MNRTIFKISAWFSLFGFINLALYATFHVLGVVEVRPAAYPSFILFAIPLWIPWIINIHFKINFPKFVLYSFNIFLVATTILGNVWDAYSFIPYYDKVIHFCSGVMIPIIFISIFMNSKDNKLNTFWLFVFALTCAISIGALWEVVEYFFDGIFSANSQNARGLMGRDALYDSIFDLLCDTLGGVVGASRALAIYHKETDKELNTLFVGN